MPLHQLAKELHVHLRTLHAAARTGRLDAHFSVRSAFGRLIRYASRAAGDQFIARHYRCFSGQELCPAPLPIVPDDYDQYVRALRRRMRLTQDALARRIGAAGKAVIYQWESRQRRPSAVFWQRIEVLGATTSADAALIFRRRRCPRTIRLAFQEAWTNNLLPLAKHYATSGD